MLNALVEEMEKRGVPVHRIISVVMGGMLLCEEELREFAEVAKSAKLEVIKQIKQSNNNVAIEAGADVIVGCHPHRPQGVEVYNGKPIFYSLGNFVYYRAGLMDYLGPNECVARVKIADGQIIKIELIPRICDSTFTGIADVNKRSVSYVHKRIILQSSFFNSMQSMSFKTEKFQS